MTHHSTCSLCDKEITIPEQLTDEDHNFVRCKAVNGYWVEVWECKDCMKMPYDNIVALRVARALES